MIRTIDQLIGDIFTIKYDSKRSDKLYFLKSPEDVLKKKMAICYDMVEFLRYHLEQLKLSCKTFYFGPKEYQEEGVTHTAIFYEQPPNGQVFFLPKEQQPSIGDRSVIGQFWHTGIVYNNKVYELFNKSKYAVTEATGRISELSALGAIFMPTVINPFTLEKQLKSGTSCGTYVARVLGMTDNRGPIKTHWPDMVYRNVSNKPQWLWFEGSWGTQKGIHGPYATVDVPVKLIEKQLNLPSRLYTKFDYTKMNIPQFGQYVCTHF